MRITENMMSNNIGESIQDNLQSLNQVQEQISSGKLIQKFSDDPTRASKSLSLGSALSSITQYQKNTDDALAWMNQTSSSLSQINSDISAATSQALSSATSTSTPQGQAAAALTVSNIISDLVSIANTKLGSSYLFGGTKTTAAPVATDGTYNGDTGQITHTVAPGQSVVVNVDGHSIFQGGGTNLIQTLQGLQTALQNGDISGINAQLTNLKASSDNVLGLEASVGAQVQRVQNTQSNLQDTSTMLTGLQSNNDDVDVAKAAIQLQTLQNSYQESISAGAQILQNSLTHFLSVGGL